MFAAAFWLWSAFVAVAAGFFGTALNCEGGEGCKPGFPSWLQPWTWGEYSVFPEATFFGLAALVVVSAFVYFIVVDRQGLAALAFVLGLALSSYPYFAGLTTSGRAIFSFGPILGLAALVSGRRDNADTSWLAGSDGP